MQNAGADKRTILIVEDNEINREILMALLEDDYNLLTAENGLEGMNILQEQGRSISAVLLDIEMPVWNGYDFLEHKRENADFADIPVIVTTANTTIDSEIKALKLGATDFVVKPYNGEAVKNRLANIVALRETSALLSSIEIDPVTKLLNADVFCIRADAELKKAQDASLLLVAVDIANFSIITLDTNAKQTDSIIAKAANALVEGVPGLIMAARYGRNGFLLLVRAEEDNLPDFAAIRPQLDSVQQSDALRFGYLRLSPDTSVRRQCANALFALDEAYRTCDRVATFDEKMLARAQRRKAIEDAMRTSLEAGEFVPYYQPKHDLAANKTGGAEALVRWIHPQLGFMNPGEFIPLMEADGFVTQVDLSVWDQVCRTLRVWIDEGSPLVPVSVNISRRDFELPDLAGTIIRMVDGYQLPHSLLHLEVTESALADNADQMKQQMNQLREAGFVIELDDFGSGYSSLAMLAEIKTDVMKLDMSLIRRDDAGTPGSIAYMAVRMAKELGMKTVAEGVETLEKAEELKALGCDFAQGYFYSKPLPLDQFEQYLRENA